jgi:23S rRNA (cytosine1962-C5)-methyltransferase
MAQLAPQIAAPLPASGWADYGLVDSGHGRKLERYGPYRFIRPEPQALWTPRLTDWPGERRVRPGIGRGRRRALAYLP